MEIEAEFPEKLRCLFEPSRYKVLYGGRGGAKSWGVARALLIQGANRPIRVLCAREFQNSITESVHSLLSDQIASLGLSSFYEIQNAYIKGKNGTEFSFAGLRHNVTKIKSYEGVDVVWVEEAQTVSKSSWETLIPTIRKPGSEIWLTFNPALETDETYQRFVVKPPNGAVVRKINWQDNPWFPDVLRQEMEQLKQRDPDAWLHVWEGNCRQMLDGAIYAKELRAAQEEGRITRVPYDQAKPVNAFFDLGRADNTSIWFVQQVGFEFRVIDFYEAQGHALSHYIKTLREKPYIYDTIYLPHDAEQELLASDRTIAQQMREANFTVTVIPRSDVATGINAARTIFNRCWFDEQKTADGLMALRHYRYDVDPDTGQFSPKPLHDIYSHAADAFRYFAVAMTEATEKRGGGGEVSISWMG
jgi:phage terminase large subunit